MRWFTALSQPIRTLLAPKPLGRRGEDAAARYLRRLGYVIVARGHRDNIGELDLVAVDGRTVVFIEVKTRATKSFGDPWEFVDWQKQQSLRRTAEEFIARYDLGEYTYRFDIVSVVAPGQKTEEIALYRNAF